VEGQIDDNDDSNNNNNSNELLGQNITMAVVQLPCGTL
jgi:hypothetical protein